MKNSAAPSPISSKVPNTSERSDARAHGSTRLCVNHDACQCQPKDIRPRTLHSHAEIWKWTLTKDAIARCRVEDVFGLQDCDGAKSLWINAGFVCHGLG